MASRAFGGMGIIAVAFLASSARAQVDAGPDCYNPTPTVDAATAPTCAHQGLTCAPAADGAPFQATSYCETPANYSSATTCCGAWLNLNCNATGLTSCDLQCGHGVCVPDAYLSGVAGGAATSALAACPVAPDGGTSKCVPNALFETFGNIHFKTCASIGGAEGRCVPRCLNALQGIGNYLPQDVCLASEACAPCYDPRTGAATGACNVGCDPGPVQPPYTFQPCCPGINDAGASVMTGLCVPTVTVAQGLDPRFLPVLKQADCTKSTDLCVPASLSISGAAGFACLNTGASDAGLDSGTPPDASFGGSAGSGGAGSGGATATGGNPDGGPDGGTSRKSSLDSGCSCRTASSGSDTHGALRVLAVGLGAALTRLRRRGRRERV